MKDYHIKMEGSLTECAFYLKAINEYEAKKEARRMHPSMVVTLCVHVFEESEDGLQPTD